MFFVEMARAGSLNAPGPFTFRGCDLTAECLPATEEVRAQLPATAPAFPRCMSTGEGCPPQLQRRRAFRFLLRGCGWQANSKTSRAPACAAESPKLSLPGAAPGRLAILLTLWGRGRQAMHLPCKQADVGALPTDSTSLRPLCNGGRRLPRRSFSEGRRYASSCTATAGRPFHCGENEIQASLISSASVGATPTPATNFREVIRQSGRNPDVSKHVGSDDWSVTSTSHHLDP